MSLFINVNISSILASIISINSELLIVTFFVSTSLYVLRTILLSLSIKDLNAKPYCLFNLYASYLDILIT